ncbi:hypothetical protein Hdeb2414_s0016g00487321 [Helianthus debilis subsp. tardiflorus]
MAVVIRVVGYYSCISVLLLICLKVVMIDKNTGDRRLELYLGGENLDGIVCML